MKTFKTFATIAATFLVVAILNAQTPPPAAPAAAPADAKPADAKPGEAKPAEPAKDVKPFSPIELRSLTVVGEVIHFHLRMGELARGKKDDKELTAFGTRVHSEVTGYLTPLISLAQKRVKDEQKDIPQAISKADKDDIDKLGKVKDEKKWRLEYYELFNKNAKRNVRNVDAALKTFQDPEMKDWGMKFSKLLTGQADQIESAYKEAKNPKKDAKK